MSELDGYEAEVLRAYEKGELTSVADKEELARFKAIARAAARLELTQGPAPADGAPA